MHREPDLVRSTASLDRRSLLTGAAWAVGAVALGRGSFTVPPAWGQSNPIKVGIATDLTGPIGFASSAFWGASWIWPSVIRIAPAIRSRGASDSADCSAT